MEEKLNELTRLIIGKAIEIHKTLGPGLLERVYQECLAFELEELGLKVEVEKVLPVIYKQKKFDNGYRLDLLVENQIVIEVKHVEDILSTHEAQVLTYMKLGQYPLGLLINFNETLLKHGIRRFIN
ncbi:MAG: GxxExxY protein [Marinilabiliaceae bacterium]|nr:GxxExxY protein [Marinilabiliaceae bacterium]